MTARLRIIAAAAVASSLAIVPAHATPPSGFAGTVQWQGPFDPMNVKVKTDDIDMRLHSKDNVNLVVTRIAIAAGGTSGWHTHPGMSLVTVLSGTLPLYDAALGTPRQLTVGQTFVDEGGDHVHLVRNETTAAAEVGAVQIMARGVPARQDVPRPNNCASNVQ
jgi:quercetin dioxygenase-like cupin family protein